MKENTIKVHMERLLLNDLWETIIKKQKEDVEKDVAAKMLKQSLYEKQMAVKILDIRLQREIMIEQKREIQQDITKEQEAKFMHSLFDKDEQLKIRKYAYFIERERTLELHRRIFEEKIRLKNERLYNFCSQCVSDLVDIAVRQAEFKTTYENDKVLIFFNLICI